MIVLTGAGNLASSGTTGVTALDNAYFRQPTIAPTAIVDMGNLGKERFPATTKMNLMGVAKVENGTAGAYYSTAYEMQLNPADFGKSRAVHFNRANAALDSALQANAAYAAQMESLIPGVKSDVSSLGGRQTPTGWTWEHAASNMAQGQSGVMRLVPTAQHTPGSWWWRILHPNAGASGGYSEWAIPAGAPKN